jgi:hypothetical protein
VGDYNPLSEEDAAGWTASAAITGGQLVEISGNGTVQPAGETSQKVLGVAAFDAIDGSLVTILDLDDYHETTVSSVGALTAGNPVKAGASGTLEEYVVGTDPVTAYLGTCITGAAIGATATWKGR